MSMEEVGLLRQNGRQITAQPLAVMCAVVAYPHGAAHDLEAARAEIGAISQQAVNDALQALTHKGLSRRIQPAGSPVVYDPRVDDNHHHVICRTCEAAADVDCTVGDEPCLTPFTGTDYRIDVAEVIYVGTCSAYAASTSGLGGNLQAGHSPPDR